VGFLVQIFVMSSGFGKAEVPETEVIDKVLELMICILNGLHNFNNMPAVHCNGLLYSR